MSRSLDFYFIIYSAGPRGGGNKKGSEDSADGDSNGVDSGECPRAVNGVQANF